MICMMIMLMCVRISALIMTTNAALLLSHQIQSFHELGYDQKVLSSGLSRKLMLKKMGEGYEDQELQVLYNDKKKALDVVETWKTGEEEVMVIETAGSDPTQFTNMDYSHVRRRSPIHNKFSHKPTNSP